MIDLSEKTVLLTGGTGSVGKAILSDMLNRKLLPRRLVIFSRDEYKQHEFREQFALHQYPNVFFALGDIRDFRTLQQCFRSVDLVIHAAALKRVDTGELHPEAFVETNITGTKNVLEAAVQQKVGRVITLSTDKAVYPTTLYGATKLCAERLAIQKNSVPELISSVIRLGNVLGSRGSIVSDLLNKPSQAEVNITHPEMTRFTMTPHECARYIMEVSAQALGGEIFIPKMNSYRLVDLVSALVPNTPLSYSQPRATEKIHEILISQEEERFVIARDQDFVICLDQIAREMYNDVAHRQLSPSFEYSSHQQSFLPPSALREMIDRLP